MTDISNIFLFLAASMALIVTPRPDLVYVVMRTLSQGRSAGLCSAAGVTTGIFLHTLAAGFGLAVLLQTSATAFTIVKYMGAAYLIYLGIKSLTSSPGVIKHNDAAINSRIKIYKQGLISNTLNPKVALFFVAFLPQFLDTEAGNYKLQMLLLGAVFAMLTLAFLSSLTTFIGLCRNSIGHSSFFKNKIHLVTGGVLVGLGARLLFLERK